jgi:hypothetical protein
MALQTHTAALNPLKTLKVTAGGGGLASATLRATINAALLAAPYSLSQVAIDAILVRVKHADILVKTGTLYMSDCGDAADASAMEYGLGEKREIRNCKELLVGNPNYLTTATVFSAGALDLRIELYS